MPILRDSIRGVRAARLPLPGQMRELILPHVPEYGYILEAAKMPYIGQNPQW